MDILHCPLATLQVRGSDARFLGYEEPEDEGEGDPEEDLLQELLLLVLRRPRASVVACAARHGSASAVGPEVHVGREEAEGERADAEGHLKAVVSAAAAKVEEKLDKYSKKTW